MSACHPSPEQHGPSDRIPVIALIGRPNVGKSTFLGRASRRFVETSNAPGTTVGSERRRISAGGRDAWLVDLPGTRALTDTPTGDEPFWKLLAAERPDALLVVVDSGDLARHLPLVLACRDLGLPVVIAANLVDEAARRGITVDTGRLRQLLGAPVHATTGRTGDGVAATVAEAVALAWQRVDRRAGRVSPRATVPATIYPYPLDAALATSDSPFRSLGAAGIADPALAALADAGIFSRRGTGSLALADLLDPHRRSAAAVFARDVEHLRDVPEPRSARIARAATSPWPGIPLFLVAVLGSFGAVVIAGGWLAAILSSAWTASVSPQLTSLVTSIVAEPAIANALLWAIDGGLLAMLSIGVPYVLTFYVLLATLEDSGYLTSAAILLDRLFSGLGLPGRAAIPLLAATGCNVPAIYGTRVLRTRRERVLASFLVTLTPCSARSAVVVAALAPFVGALAAFAAFGLIVALALGAGFAANALVPGRQNALVLELAPLRRPLARHVMAKAWSRFRSFVVTATPIMLLGSFALGLVYEAGLWTPLASAIEPVSRGLLGLPAIVTVAIAFSVLRKELALQLLIAFAAVQAGSAAAAADLGTLLTPGQLFVYAIVVAVSIPCVATLAALRAELGGRVAAAIAAASLGLAVGAGSILAHLLGLA